MSLGRAIAFNASAVAVGRVILIGTGVVSVGISTRYLGVAAFGALAAATAFVTLLGPLTDVGLSEIGAREIAKRPDERDELLGSIMTVGLFLSCVTAVVGFGVVHLIYAGDKHELVRHGAVLLILTVPLSAPVSAAYAYLVAEQKAYVSVFASVAGSVVTLALLIGAVIADLGFTGVVIAYAGYGIVYSGSIVAFALRKVRLRFRTDLAGAKELVRWAVPLGAAAVVHSFYVRIDLILLSFLSSASETALYGLAYKILEALYVLPFIVAITLLPEFSRLSEHRERLGAIMQKTVSAVLVVVAPLVIFLVVFAPQVMETVGGKGFGRSGTVLQIMMLAVAAYYLTSIFVQALVAANRQGQVLKTWLAVLIVNVGLNLVLIPQFDARGAAIALVISEVLALGIVMAVYRKVGTLPRLERGPQLAFALGAMAVAGLCVQLLPVGDVATLAVGGVVTFAAYGVSLLALGGMPSEVRSFVVTGLRPLLARR